MRTDNNTIISRVCKHHVRVERRIKGRRWCTSEDEKKRHKIETYKQMKEVYVSILFIFIYISVDREGTREKICFANLLKICSSNNNDTNIPNLNLYKPKISIGERQYSFFPIFSY